MIKINMNGYEKTGDKETLLRLLKDPEFVYMEFNTPVYFAGQYIDTVQVKIQRGDNYCTPQNKNKIYTSINLKDQVGLRPAQKAIRSAEIIKVDVTMRRRD